MDNGDVYDGNFKRGAFCGHGVYFSFESSSFLNADFVNNKPETVIERGSIYPS